MATYQFRYRLQDKCEASNDGSSVCKHDIYAQGRIAGSGDDWVDEDGRHKSGLAVPAATLQAVMDMPHSSGSEKQAKNAAYKQALAANLDTIPSPNTSWTKAGMQARRDANDASVAACAEADAYLTETLNLSYPIPFNI